MAALTAGSADAFSADRLFEIGWPGESARAESRAQRVYTALWTLRKLGLEEALHRTDEGYCISKSVRLRVVGSVH